MLYPLSYEGVVPGVGRFALPPCTETGRFYA